MYRAAVLAFALLAAGCAASGTVDTDAPYAAVGAPAAPLRPLVLGWQQFFKLDWQPAEKHGRPVLYGHVYNNWGFPATDVRLLVDGLDAAGRVVEQRVEWLGSVVTPGTTAPFEVALARPAASYRVEVFSFDWLQTDGGSMPR
jgi:hypothetical protein